MVPFSWWLVGGVVAGVALLLFTTFTLDFSRIDDFMRIVVTPFLLILILQ